MTGGKTMNLCTNLNQKRVERDLTQTELAKYAGISPTMINYIESGMKVPSLAVTIKIADVLHCSIDDLVGRTVT